jgi:hypothetical protein
MAYHHPSLAFLLLFAACGGRFETAEGAGGATGTPGSGGSAHSGGSSPDGGWTGSGGAANTGGWGAAGGSSMGGSAGTAGVDPTACTASAECTLVPVSCCGGQCEPTMLASFVAVNQNEAHVYTDKCALVDCMPAPCAYVPPEKRNRPYFASLCQAGHCQAVDIRTTSITECVTDLDCRLRVGVSCCEGCGATVDNVIALSAKANLWQTFCGQGDIGCPACMPIMPAYLYAGCEPAPAGSPGRCRVRTMAVDAGPTPY